MKKIDPLCPYFNECGGCAYQDISYNQELAIKENQLKENLSNLSDDIFDPIVSSPKPYHYRHRIDLKLQKTKSNGTFIGFTPKEGFGILPIEQCAIAEEVVSASIPQIKDEALAVLPEKYRQANLVVRTGDAQKVRWGGIGRGSLQLDEKDFFWTEINGRKIFYSLETFFQANLSILPELITTIRSFDFWADDVSFYDLYGGVGLFSISLHDKVSKVVHIEDNKESTRLALYNADAHGLLNFESREGRVEDCLKGYLKEDRAKTKIAMIDPPRAGLSRQALDMLVRTSFDYLMYLSCNPNSLAQDLDAFIQNGWQAQKVIPFDFFPKTKHLESLTILVRRD